MVVEDRLTRPSLLWRAISTVALVLTGTVSKVFLSFASRAETHGLDGFLNHLKEREDVAKRRKGLLTVSNHVSVVDDPLIWGFLPYRYLRPDNCRWSLGSYDICFKDGSNSSLSKYFMLGQTLPTHRLAYSPDGGLFQPTITQCIRLLSRGPFTQPAPPHPDWFEGLSHQSVKESAIDSPFTNPTATYTTTGTDRFQAPSAYGTRRHAWVHVFPEGKIHQHPDRLMRYLKWGVARLILESEPCPTVVPMWIEGPDEVMHESRTWPRWFPRIFGKNIDVTFGDPVPETLWEGFRERWRRLKSREIQTSTLASEFKSSPGGTFEFMNDELRYGPEAKKLRMEVAFTVREEILKLRRARGWPDEDPKARLIDTFREEGGKREGKMDDESWVKDT